MTSLTCLERRTATRQSVDIAARFRRSRRGRMSDALVEDIGGDGLRLRTAEPLQPRQVIVLDEAGPLTGERAEVVWVRREGLIKVAPGKFATSFNAGCRVIEPARKFTLPDADQAVKYVRRGLFAGAILLGSFVAWSVLQVILAMR